MWVGAKLGDAAQGDSLGCDREHGACGEVDPDPDHIGRIDSGFGEHRPDSRPEGIQIVVGVLQRPIGGQRSAVTGKTFVDDP